MATNQKTVRRNRRKKGIRKRVFGTPERPRLTVFRSSKHLYAQIVNDLEGTTLVAANSIQQKLENGSTLGAAQAIGSALAEKAKAAGVSKVAFDRNGFRFHGRVKALAEAAREGGLQF